LQQLRTAKSSRDELHTFLIEPVQICVGRQFRVENQFLGQLASAPFPELNERHNLVILLLLSQIRVGNLAKPSCRKTWATATGVRAEPSFFKASLMSYTDGFYLRRRTICFRTASSALTPGRVGSIKNERSGWWRNWWTSC
jgi:hypothetical protein